MKLSSLLAFLFLIVSLKTLAQCDSTQLLIHKVSASTLDASITPFEFSRHHSFFNPDCSPKNTLVFFLVGTYGSPSNDLLIPKLAANYGYHVISINYPNNKSASFACGNDIDTNCYTYFHEEAIFGTDLLDTIQIDTANSIYTRSIKFLNYLASTFPTENWSQFLSGNDIDWTKVITAGHSQGSGHAAYLAHKFPVQRALLFAGPNEYMNNYNKVASWFSEASITADSNFYGFGNIGDEFNMGNQYEAWSTIGMLNYGDTIDVSNFNCPYNNTRMLYTKELATGPISPFHNSVAVDNYVPKDINNVPLFENVWKYMLGICDLTTSIETKKSIAIVKLYPNPSNGHFTIEFPKVENNISIKIMNLSGELVLENYFDLIKKDILNIQNLTPGIYLVDIIGLNINQRN
ncbi:MAG: T9SS type A sorting domain-containing protein, partial [Flavobacteriales bacterium]|nr:T9SS type A sorting domain-containing protein [Flavobacteriales bacterium]